MNKRAITLIELLIVIVILSVLISFTVPYYQDYVRQARHNKALHELDIIKLALIKYDTFEELPFSGDNLRVLLGRYLQDLPPDPWGRDYQVDHFKGQIRSFGPSITDEKDDILIDYKPQLALYKATWIDADNNKIVSNGDMLRLEFSRHLVGDKTLIYSNASPPIDIPDSSLWFSSCFDVAYLANAQTATSTDLILTFDNIISPVTTDVFFPGSSTVRISPYNQALEDHAGRKALGSLNVDPGLEIKIRANY